VTRDWFQVIAFRLGYHTIDGAQDVHCTDRRAIGIRGTNGKGLNVDRVEYDGVVWCPKTPNGTWVARRNGRPFITGNTFPPELCEKPIKSSCPPRVCADCGAPYEREVEDKGLGGEAKIQQGERPAADERGVSESSLLRTNGRTWREREFKGWTPTCDCATDATQPGIVLDPFCGTGTACLVGKRLGRRFVGIDLDPESVALAQQRVGVTVDEPERLTDDDATAFRQFTDGVSSDE
jgi:DNA modification methylase